MKRPLSNIFYALACLVILSGSGCKKKKENNTYQYPYSINYTGCPCAGNMIKFTIWNDFEPLPSTCLWNFGDGAISTDLNGGSHAFTQPGTYTVTLTVNNDKTNPASLTINITSQNFGSHYTTLLAGIRQWNGTDDNDTYPYSLINYIDTPMAIQVVDSGTIIFMGFTLHLVSIDTSRKVLIYYDCTNTSNGTISVGPRLDYKYIGDTIWFSNRKLRSSNYNFSGMYIHSP